MTSDDIVVKFHSMFHIPEIYYASVDTYLINKFKNKLIIIYDTT